MLSHHDYSICMGAVENNPASVISMRVKESQMRSRYIIMTHEEPAWKRQHPFKKEKQKSVGLSRALGDKGKRTSKSKFYHITGLFYHIILLQNIVIRKGIGE